MKPTTPGRRFLRSCSEESPLDKGDLGDFGRGKKRHSELVSESLENKNKIPTEPYPNLSLTKGKEQNFSLLRSELSVDEALASGDSEGCKKVELLSKLLNLEYDIKLFTPSLIEAD